MDTTLDGRGRKYSGEFRATALAESCQSGESMASVTLNYGLNANMVLVWPRSL